MKRIILVVGIIMFGFTIAVGICIFSLSVYDYLSPPRCSNIPDGISEADLIGTWVAGNPSHRDSLIIQSNGYYKQLVHIDFTDRSPMDYESDWQPWHLEYFANNPAYLHLIGFRFCGMNEGISCDESNGDGYDFCRDEYIRMTGEGILLVLGQDNHLLSNLEQDGKIIWLAYPLGSENSWTYNRWIP